MGKLEDIRDHRDRNGEDFRKRKRYAVPPAQWEQVQALADKHEVRVDNLLEAVIRAGIWMLERQDDGMTFYLSQEPKYDEFGTLRIAVFGLFKFD